MAAISDKSRCFTIMMASMFFCYLAMVMPMAPLSVCVGRDWGMSGFHVGLLAGAAFFITMFFRKRGGELADRRGGRFCYVRGCLIYAVGGIICLSAALEGLPLPARYAFLLAGRLTLGVGESLTNVGMAHWSVSTMGTTRSGRVFATIGMSMYAAVGVGGRLGFLLFDNFGLFGLIAACVVSPLLALALVRRCPAGGVEKAERVKTTYKDIMARIWRFGLPVCCHAVAFPVLGAFLAQTFLNRHWPYSGWGLTAWGVGFVVMRLCIGHLPDKVGGFPVAAGSLVVQLGGLIIILFSDGPWTALIGAFLTGAGTSMVAPSVATELVKAIPTHLRGVSISCYNIFSDIAYGFAGPAAGLFSDAFGDKAPYLFAALSVGAALLLVLRQVKRCKGGDVAA